MRAAEIDGVDRAMQHNTELLVRSLANARRASEPHVEAGGATSATMPAAGAQP